MAALKLFTIGDSISQGFMSLAAARTDLCYSTVVTKTMGWDKDYHYPLWANGGHPLNLEELFLKITKKIGDTWEEWNLLEAAKIYNVIGSYLDETESYYERGKGKYQLDYDNAGQPLQCFHNIAVRGFNVSDAWTVSQDLSARMIKKAKGSNTDDTFSGPSASFFRTAARVLNPNSASGPVFNTYTAIDWLKHHAEAQGIENVFLWLGANNALGTVTKMNIRQTNGKLDLIKKIDPADMGENRQDLYKQYENTYSKYSLWHVDDFCRDYNQLLDYVGEALQNAVCNTKIFVATVPFVTILPLARGMGKEWQIDDKRYFEYYTYFPFDDEKLAEFNSLPALRLSEILFIEETIKAYNKIIYEAVKAQNAKPNRYKFFVVDISTTFEQLAFRRNKGVPPYPMPAYINHRYPKPDTRYYERSKTHGSKGGLFSLDGVHPSAIGQGIIAYEFMKTMLAAKVPGIPTEQGYNNMEDKNNDKKIEVPKLNWEEIYKTDSLYNFPIHLVSDIFKHDTLKKLVLRFSEFLSKANI